MKINNGKTPQARTVALKILSKVWDEGAYANLALSSELSKHDLPDIERHFVTELVYGAVKAGQVLDLLLRKFTTRPLQKIPPLILNILRLGLYQIYFLERIPDSAANNEAVKQARRFGHEGTVKFVNAVLRSAVRFKENPGLASDPQLQQAVLLQHPQWLVQRWEQQIGGEQTQQLCTINNKPAPMCLRTNTLQITPEKLAQLLSAEGVQVEKSAYAAEGFICTSNPALVKLDSFRQGYYQVQDESSMLVGHYLEVQPGQNVLDLCAAPGGKTTHLAVLMQNQGKVIATDIHAHKLAIINENARRLGIDIIEAQLHDATVFNKTWQESFDRVLVDAPCSGFGVLRRRPDLRWRKQPAELAVFPPLQLQILQNGAKYLRQGGKLVYSTCTTEQAENFAVIEKFLNEHKEFALTQIKHPRTGELTGNIQLWPQLDGTDGFFICVLQKQ